MAATPEVVGMMGARRKAARDRARPEESHEVLAALRALAAELSVWLLIGSISVIERAQATREPAPDPLPGPTGISLFLAH